jgi:hypothetical protein
MFIDNQHPGEQNGLGAITNSLCFEVLENIVRYLSDDPQAILSCSEVSRNMNVVARQFAFHSVDLDRLDSTLFYDVLKSNQKFTETHDYWPLMKGTRSLTLNLEIGDILLEIFEWCPNLQDLSLEGHQPTLLELQALPGGKLRSLTLKDGLDIEVGDDPSLISFPNLVVCTRSVIYSSGYHIDQRLRSRLYIHVTSSESLFEER